MKQFTFSAQVANNLLTVLQGYSKTIRLLLVMFVALTVSAEVWADYTIAFKSTTGADGSTAQTTIANLISSGGTNVSTISATRAYNGKSGYGIKLGSSSSTGNVIMTLANSAQIKASKLVVKAAYFDSGKTLKVTVTYTDNNTTTQTLTPASSPTDYDVSLTDTKTIKQIKIESVTASKGRMYCHSIKVVAASAAPSHTITATSNNNSYGTVSVSGTTITATPNAGYRIKSGDAGYTVTSGTAVVTNNGNNTFSVTPSSNCTITINFEAIPTYTINWHTAVGTVEDEVLEEGATITKPATNPTMTGYEFMGWTEDCEVASDGAGFTAITNFGTATEDKDYYAVFAEATTTGGGGGSTDVTIDLTDGTQVTTNSTENLVFTEGDVTFTNTKVSGSTAANNYSPVSSTVRTSTRTYNGHQVTIAAGSTISKIVITAASTSYATAIKNATWTNGTATASSSTVTVTPSSGVSTVSFAPSATAGMTEVVVTTGGGGSTTYDNYITTCAAGDPCASLQAPNVTATATANSITLSWEAVDGATSYNVYNYTTADLDETTSLTYTFTGLSSETEYEWGVESAKDECFKETRGTTTTPAAASPATITLSALGVTSTIDTYSVGDQYTLPNTSSQSCAGKQLVGWSTVEVAETDTKPTENYYELGAEVTLAATQTFYAVFAAGSGGGGETTVDLSISDYATANSWSDATQYATVNIDENITATAEGENNTGKYYENGENWRLYQTENPILTLTAKDGCTIKQITIAYTITNTGTLTFGGSNISSGTACEINATSAVFGVGNTSSATNGQVRITQISVTYSGGGGYTAYSTSCIPTYSITYDFADGDGGHCTDTRVEGGSDYTICDEAPTKDGNTFLHWSDGVNTYDPSDVIANVTTDITLTAVWQPNTYTVTWNNNGVTTSKNYNHGETLEVPTAPASCDGVKEFVGWTTHSGYYHATTAPDDIFTTKTTPVTATATYYAVFATPGAGGTEFVLGESGTFKMYANVNGTNYYAQGGVSSDKLSSTTDILTASDYILTYADGSYTIKQGTSAIGHSSKTDLSTTASTWTISAGDNGSWRITSGKDNSRALSYSAEANAFKAYATSNLTAGNETYFDIEFGSGSDAHSDYTTICQTVESIEIANYTTEFFVTDEFAFGGTVTAHFDGGGEQDVTALAHFSGYNMNVTGTQTVTVTYMGATATYEITVKPLDNAWVLTWNVSGKTNTGLGPRSVTKGSAIVTLPTPEVPAACAGKTFMGWTESNIVPSDGKGIVYITEETVPTKNTTYYAVFATVNNFCTQKPIDQIASGSKVVIVAVASLDAGGTTGKAISSRTAADGNNLASDDVFVLDEQINTPHSTCVWTLTREVSGKYTFTQDGKYLNAVVDPDKTTSGFCKFNSTKDTWTISEISTNTYRMLSSNQNKYVEWFTATGVFKVFNVANTFGTFDMQFFVTANANGGADITDYTTGCEEYTITYYGFRGGYSTSCSSDGTIVLPVNSIHTIPNCEGLVINDHTNLGREFLKVWMTQPHGGHTFKPGDTFILTQDTTLYAQWKMETTSDVTTLPTDIEDLAGTDIYVYGGTTLNIQPGTTTINSLTLKGGLQADGSYKMPTVWVPEGATLVRNSNKINLDLIVNAKTWYPFAVPFATKNNQYVEYLNPELAAASTYGTHFAIKTYDGARRADVGEDKANNWVRVLREETLQPGVGYIITALTYPDKDTATIRIPMTVPNTWFQNGEQAVVGTTVRNTIAVTAHAGDAATEHQRHAGWNFVANPYLTSFAGGNVDNDGGLAYINGELIIEGGYEYTDEEVPYVTVPAYDFAYYSQHKLSDVKLSPEWSFFVQVGTGGTMNFTTAGRQQAPASIAARNAEERPVKMDVDLILSDNHNSDQTGIIISDRYTDAYEIGRDLEKLFGSAYNLSVYTLMEDNTPLAFQALAIRSSMQVIPVGYRAPEQGEYTFRLNEATSSIDLLNEQYEQLVLVDYQTGELTNLLYTDYTFYSERTQSNSRFAIYAVPRQNAPTDLPNAIGSDEEVRKVIYNDHLYILRDGNVYNGMGQKM